MNLKKIAPVSTLMILMVTTLLVQTHVKLKPLIIISIYTMLTILFFILKKDKLSTVLLAPIILLWSYFFWYIINDKIKDTVFPRKQVSGEYIMDGRYVYCIAIAIVLCLMTAFLYFTKTERHKKGETYILTLYLISTIAIICYKYL